MYSPSPRPGSAQLQVSSSAFAGRDLKLRYTCLRHSLPSNTALCKASSFQRRERKLVAPGCVKDRRIRDSLALIEMNRLRRAHLLDAQCFPPPPLRARRAWLGAA
nr:hypothetical protein CFP56_02590 [Quercus suber]